MTANPRSTSINTPPPTETVAAGDGEHPAVNGRLTIEIADEQQRLDVGHERITRAIRQVAAAAGVGRGSVSVALVDDPTIAELHSRYLGLDSATDVLSFVLEREDTRLDGEVVISTDTAARAAEAYSQEPDGWNAADEVLLYVVHGMLHLVGYDDIQPDAAQQMRAAERRHLAEFGLVPPGR